jgi:hypothetical protein
MYGHHYPLSTVPYTMEIFSVGAGVVLKILM